MLYEVITRLAPVDGPPLLVKQFRIAAHPHALRERLNGCAGLTCHGELFNPSFIGHPGSQAAFGMTLSAREADPLAMLAAVTAAGDRNNFV